MIYEEELLDGGRLEQSLPMAGLQMPSADRDLTNEAKMGRKSTSTGSLMLSAGLMVLGLAGCATSTTDTTSGSTAGPGAGQRVDRAQQQTQEAAQCLKEAGWDVTLEDDFSITSRVPPAQSADYRADSRRCMNKFDEKSPDVAVSDDEWRTLYKHQLWLVTCLSEQGYPPVDEPPSENQFVADSKAQKQTWMAYEAVGGVAGPEKLAKECPQDPPGW